MALRVWLPMHNGTLTNQGLSDVTITNNGATVDNNGKLGKCYSFDGTSKYISLTNPLDDASEVSCSVWVKPSTNTSTNEQIMNVGTSSGWNNIRFGILQRSVNQFVFHVSDGTNNITYSCISGTITVDQWIHIGCVYKEKTLKMYLNGELVKTYSISFNPSFSGISKIGIGAAPNGAEKFTGFITDFRLYDHALSPLEVKRISQGLILHYPLNNNGFGNENILTNSTGYNETTDWSGLMTVDNENGSPYLIAKRIDTTSTGRTFCSHSVITSLVSSWNAGDPFTISGYYRVPSNEAYEVGANLFIRWTYTTTSGSPYSDTGFTTPLTAERDEWIRFKNTYTVPVSYENGAVSFTISAFAKGLSTVHWKNVKLEKGDKATPWCPNSSDELATTMGMNDGIEYDCSGFGNNGTRVGDFSWSSDTPRYLSSTYMPKTTLITHPRPVFGGTDQEWTCAMWVKLDTVNQSGIAMNSFNNGNNIVHSANGTPLLYLNGGSNDYYMYGKKAINANEWTHIVFVFRNSYALRNIYINGELSNNYGINKTSTPSGIQDIIKIGSNLAGYISDYRIYATALSADDVLALYNLGGSLDSNGTFHTYEYVEV